MKSNIKGEVKEYYGKIAKKVSDEPKESCGCGVSCCTSKTDNLNLYTKDFIEGLPEEVVNASLGCANPVVLANPQKGEVVLDLGSGGGIDVFISSKYVGESGKVYGLDMTDEMLELANKNKKKMDVKNVKFLKGYIEDIPLEDGKIDVVTSNCVINLCESKENALAEAYRVLKKGGRLAIADIVILKDIPDSIKQSVEMWVGCIAGALPVKEYAEILKKVGFSKIEITPVNIYTKEVIEDIAKQKNLGDVYSKIDSELVNGAFAGAHVKAYKL
ncbi:Methyltransferase domain-containing protein [Clostridium acidisoli DSM 12555]|uniref:Arsenite methyltransferase n=1 Tax=Clostridium acidisoli DSM 12555 TaxID=1121291 RepID=A0A1W1XPR2_9CLOT|nr:arsenite methyltransferase [Clostridium acidisoli]SMC25511.1 Methyltransferase domain-containing protein [Clostridium acidisoli DSM 12555]